MSAGWAVFWIIFEYVVSLGLCGYWCAGLFTRSFEPWPVRLVTSNQSHIYNK